MSTVMETYSGLNVDLARPDPKQITIDDIAWHLSRIPRFGGACRSENTYCLAQHSVLVLNRLRQINPNASVVEQITALLHDAHEAYTGDPIRPIKNLLEFRHPIDRFQNRMQRAIYLSLFGSRFEPSTALEIRDADDWALAYEAYHLMHSKGKDWADSYVLDDEHILRVLVVWDPITARDRFLSYFRQLAEQYVQRKK